MLVHALGMEPKLRAAIFLVGAVGLFLSFLLDAWIPSTDVGPAPGEFVLLVSDMFLVSRCAISESQSRLRPPEDDGRDVARGRVVGHLQLRSLQAEVGRGRSFGRSCREVCVGLRA